MADASQFAGAASAIYDPQIASENATTDASHTNTLAGLSASEAKIDPTYTTAFKAAADARASEAAKTDFQYSQAFDGNASGLHDNATIQQGNRYQDEVKKLAGEEAQAHTDVGTQRNAENTSYAALRSSIASKYAGLKSGFVQDQLDKANQREFDVQMEQRKEAAAQRLADSNNASARLLASESGQRSDRQGYNDSLAELDKSLRGYQASGYKGTLNTSRAAMIDDLSRRYGGVANAGDVNKIFDRYYLDGNYQSKRGGSGGSW